MTKPFTKRNILSRTTIRGRLTLVYGGLFLVAGVLLLAVTYLLVSYQLPAQVSGSSQSREITSPATGGSQQNGPTVTFGSSGPDDAVVNKVVLDTRTRALSTLLTQGGLALALVCATAIALGWLLAGRLLQPLHRITETARRIANAPAADRGLHERIAMDGPHDEVRQLADTFDVMLEHLDHSFDGQRRFIANASHELRTPLTLNRTLLEVALTAETASPELRQLGTTLLAINTRHGRLIDGLLLLARSEAEVIERSNVDLADIAEHLATQLPPGTVSIETATAEAETTGNPVLLERLVQNLIENGVRHNLPDGGWVRVTTGAGPEGTAVLRVSNTGPVVAPYDVPNLFEPFRRIAADRLATSTGAGLGLSIVRAIARAHGGDVDAEPRDGGGLIVTVTLPI